MPLVSLGPVAVGGAVMAAMVGYCYNLWVQRDDDENNSGSLRNLKFSNFASVEVEGEQFMTAEDFMESIIADHPRQR